MSIADKLNTIAENQEKVFEAGKTKEWSDFWDNFQLNGNRTNYINAFSGAGWNYETFFPKYDINADASGGNSNNAQGIFSNFNNDSRYQAFDFAERLEKQGVKLLTSTWEKHYGSFSNMKVTRLPELDFSNASGGGYTFQGSIYLITIDKIISSVNTYWDGCFNYCYDLVNLIIEGEIGTNFIIRFSTKLSKASITSIVNALSDNVSGKTVTFSKTAKESAFTTDEWASLIATKPNWTFSLA